MTEGQRAILENLARSLSAPYREVIRAKALLLAAEGVASTAIAAEVGVSPASVAAWRERFSQEGFSTFARVRAGRGRPPRIPAEKIDEIVRLTQTSTPPSG